MAEKGAQSMRLAVLALAAAIVIAVTGVGVALYLRSEEVADNAQHSETFSLELRRGLVRSCERNGNPTREAVRSLIEEQIRNSESPVVRQLFPQIPTALIEVQIAADRERLKEVAPVDCAHLYPRP
jgi:hypothetical protein